MMKVMIKKSSVLFFWLTAYYANRPRGIIQ